MDITPAEAKLRNALRMFTILFVLAIPLYLLPAFVAPKATDWFRVGFVVNSVTKVAVLAGLCSVAASNIRRFSPLVPIIVTTHFISVSVAVCLLIWGDPRGVLAVWGIEVSPSQFLWASVIADSSIAVLFLLLFRVSQRARYGVRYLSPTAFETLAALADILVAGQRELLTPEQIATNADRYLAALAAQRKWIVKWGLRWLYWYPLLRLRPTLALMSPHDRLAFVRQRFLAGVSGGRRLRPLRMLSQAAIRLAQQLVFFGYYGDPRTYASVGYVPFSQRKREAVARAIPRGPTGVAAMRPGDLERDHLEADLVVVGSGASGAILAYKLAERGRDVLLLERGKYIEPSDFTEDEIEMLSLLYADGALQLSRDFRFQVIQGMCVGGSTVVNNAVCFDPPPAVVKRWNATDLDAGLDEARLQEATAAVRKWLSISRQDHPHLHPGAQKFVEGVRALGLNGPPHELDIVEANIADCLGCGYCNIGCRYGKKLSMLDTVLPQGRSSFGDGFRILSECKVERVMARRGRAEGLVCRLSNGRRLDVRAKTVVIAAGAIHSSYLLRRSRLGGPRVGENVSFNMGSPMTADFDEKLDSYDGLQISHYFRPGNDEGFVMETWFNPVATQALAMPGWFEQHWQNMHRYAHLTGTGVLVGTERNGRVRRGLLGGPDIVFRPRASDLRKLVAGLKLLGRIYLAAGARRVMPTTLDYIEITSEADLPLLDRFVSDTGLSIASGHPQGGNAMSRDPQKGVIDPSFRVHGCDNLYVCDASIFPSSLTVNPQLTVMAFAHVAGETIE